MAAAGEDIVRTFIARLVSALEENATPPYSMLAKDIKLYIAGTTPISGLYVGHDQIKGVLISTLKTRLRSAHVELAEIIADGNRIAALVRITALANNGSLYNCDGSTCGAVFFLRNRKISEIRLFPDTTEVETVIFNRRYRSLDAMGMR